MFITLQPSDTSDFVVVNTDQIASVDFALERKSGSEPWPVMVTLASGRRITAYHSGDKSDDGYADSLDAFCALEALLKSVQFSGALEDGRGLRQLFDKRQDA